LGRIFLAKKYFFGLKSEKSKKNPAESMYARIFSDEN